MALIFFNFSSPTCAIEPFKYSCPVDKYNDQYNPIIDKSKVSFNGSGIEHANTGVYARFSLKLQWTPLIKGFYMTMESNDTLIASYVNFHKNINEVIFTYLPKLPGLYILRIDYITEDFVPVHLIDRQVSITGEVLIDLGSQTEVCTNETPFTGSWIKCTSKYHVLNKNESAEMKTGCLRRGGMIFKPHKCHYEVYSTEDLQKLSLLPADYFTTPSVNRKVSRTIRAHKHSVVFLGHSVTRGFFLSFVDTLLGEHSRGIESLSKCWGHIRVEFNNISLSYQDLRAPYLSTYPIDLSPQIRKYTCHMDRLVMDQTQMAVDTTHFMKKLMATNPDTLVIQIQDMMHDDYSRLEEILIFKTLLNIPDFWKGNMIVLIHRTLVVPSSFSLHQPYPREFVDLWNLHFKRKVFMFDTDELVVPFQKHTEFGIRKISTHYHYVQSQKKGEINVFGIVADMIATIIMNVHFKSRSESLKAANEYSMQYSKSPRILICEDCPPEMLPFHIIAEPKLSCSKVMPSVKNWIPTHMYARRCPENCMKKNPDGSFILAQGKSIEYRDCYKTSSNSSTESN